MKIQDDPTQLLDVEPTHFRCIDCDQTISLEGQVVSSASDVRCPNEFADEDHPVELIHVADKPLASPSAVQKGENWDGLDPFDMDRWHFGNRRFEYGLED